MTFTQEAINPHSSSCGPQYPKSCSVEETTPSVRNEGPVEAAAFGSVSLGALGLKPDEAPEVPTRGRSRQIVTGVLNQGCQFQHHRTPTTDCDFCSLPV